MENTNELLLEELKILREERAERKKGEKFKFLGFSIIVLNLVASMVYAATVTKPHTFKEGDTASASEVNANFDTLYNLLNGQLDNDNIKEIDASKITTGKLSAAILPDGSTGTVINQRLDATLTPSLHSSHRQNTLLTFLTGL